MSVTGASEARPARFGRTQPPTGRKIWSIRERLRPVCRSAAPPASAGSAPSRLLGAPEREPEATRLDRRLGRADGRGMGVRPDEPLGEGVEVGGDPFAGIHL